MVCYTFFFKFNYCQLIILDFTVDWWALGVILYEFLVGIPPFYDNTTTKIFQNILKGEITWPSIPDEMSYEAHDLIKKLLTENPAERLGKNGALFFFFFHFDFIKILIFHF